MVRRWLIVLLFIVPLSLTAQELLVPASAPLRPVPRKTAVAPLQLPFFDDFSRVAGAPDPALWDSGGAVVGTGFGQLPPTVGMLSLDALDAEGRLYSHASTSLFAADTATSLPIRLDSLAVGDSLAFSFFYLPGGGSGNLWERMGDAPNPRDSLFLDFYCAGSWRNVWSRGGVSVDTLIAATGRAWQYVCLPLLDSLCFDSAFRFRFRNYCSLDDNGKVGTVSNADQWNIDYVLLDSGRSAVAEPVFRDVAFVGEAPSMLKHYRAMPARQYRLSDMAQSLSLTVTNLYSSPLATQYGYSVYDTAGNAVCQPYDGGYENAPPYLPSGSYQTAAAHATPPVGFVFDEGDDYRTYTIVHTVREGTGGDERWQNDTVRYAQVFANYYAYDDGSPENGYGLTSTASTIYLAYRFDLNVSDTLTAVDLYFNPTLGAVNENIKFHLSVWRADGGRPATLLYRDSEHRLPQTGGFARYRLEYPLPVNGSIFVGFEQEGNDYINLGFDRSFNSADRIYYLTSTDWQQSILSGSLMLRPVFGDDPTTAVRTVGGQQPKLWPSPAATELRIDAIGNCRIDVFNAHGRSVYATAVAGTATIDVRRWPSGIYMLRTLSPEGRVATAKFIIQH